MGITRTIGAGASTVAIDCAYCRHRGDDCQRELSSRANSEDRVLQCERYYPQALQNDGLREGSAAGEERRSWMQRVRFGR